MHGSIRGRDVSERDTSEVGKNARARWIGGAVGLCAGVVLVYLGSVGAPITSPVIRLGLVAIGIATLVRSLDCLGKSRWGDTFGAGWVLSAAWILTLIVAASLADVLPLGNHSDTSKTVGVRGFQRPDLFSNHPLGTNNFGLDLLARAIYGARVSLLTVALTMVLSLLIGGAIGVVAGYFRGAIDTTVNVVVDAALAIPALVTLIAFSAMFGVPTTVADAVIKTGVALAIVGIPTMVRLARANTLVIAQREFVMASRSVGAKTRRIIAREIVPNVMLPMMSYALTISAVLIVAEGSLSFIGLGLQQPAPSWGSMIAEGGLRTLRRDPHVIVVPGAFMFVTVYSLNVLGDFARSRWIDREHKG